MSIKQKIRQIVKAITAKPVALHPYAKESYSQSGEDIIIEYLFRLRDINTPSCLDIGAFDPVFANNTYKFFLRGAKCVNIDANPYAIEKFNTTRPADINLNIGVGAQKGSFDFYIMNDEALNTFSVTEKEHLERSGSALKEVKTITMLPVNEVLEQYFSGGAPDLLSIDAEGVDMDIIRTLDFKKFLPKVICIESINYTPDGTGTKRLDLCEMIEAAGYYEYANTNINSIFVNKAWWFKAK